MNQQLQQPRRGWLPTAALLLGNLRGGVWAGVRVWLVAGSLIDLCFLFLFSFCAGKLDFAFTASQPVLLIILTMEEHRLDVKPSGSTVASSLALILENTR